MIISKEFLIGFIVVFTSPCINIIFHEFGHFFVGLYYKYKFISFKLLGFMLYKQNGDFKLKYTGVGLSLGQVCMIPKDENSSNRNFDLGGAYGQVALLVVYICLYKFIGLKTLIVTLLFSLLMLSLNMYPICKRGVVTDGYFYKHFKEKDRLLFYNNSLIHFEHTFKSYKDIDDKLYTVSRTGNTLLDNQNIYLAVVCKYIANGLYDKAIVHLENLHNRLKGYDNALALEVLADLYTIYIIKGKINKIDDKQLKILKRNSKNLVSCARFMYLYDDTKKYRKLYKKLHKRLPYISTKEYEDQLVEAALYK